CFCIPFARRALAASDIVTVMVVNVIVHVDACTWTGGMRRGLTYRGNHIRCVRRARTYTRDGCENMRNPWRGGLVRPVVLLEFGTPESAGRVCLGMVACNGGRVLSDQDTPRAESCWWDSTTTETNCSRLPSRDCKPTCTTRIRARNSI